MIIAGASIYDPATGANGARGNICISGDVIGRTSSGQTFNATGCIAMAGGLDIHSHPLALAKLARLSGALEEWGDLKTNAREFLASGITFFAEAGLKADEADLAEGAAREAIGAGILCLEDAGTPFIARKVFGFSGMEYCLAAPEAAVPPHLHLPELAREDAFEIFSGFAKKLGGRRCHLSHLSHYAFAPGKGRARGCGAKAAAVFDAARGITADCGPVVFGPALTFTADEELAGRVAASGGGRKVAHPDSRFRAAPYRFEKERYIDSLLWINGIEFILAAEDLSRLSLSIDFPSGGKISGYPHIIACLMERDRRAAVLAGLNADAVAETSLRGMKRELSLSEIALITRAAPAAALGLATRGTLKDGAAADVVIYRQTGDIERMFASPRQVVRGGKTVFEDGKWK